MKNFIIAFTIMFTCPLFSQNVQANLRNDGIVSVSGVDFEKIVVTFTSVGGNFTSSPNINDWNGARISLRFNYSAIPIVSGFPTTQLINFQNESPFTFGNNFGGDLTNVFVYTLDEATGGSVSDDGFRYFSLISSNTVNDLDITASEIDILSFLVPESWACSNCIEIVNVNSLGASNPISTEAINSVLGEVIDGTSDQTFLPLELTTFTVQKREAAAQLTWETATEINSSHFEIERSGDGKDWEAIGKVQAQNQSNLKTSYNYDDDSAADFSREHKGDVYYRLKMVDQDGSYEYSHVRSLRYEGRAFSLQTYPNPTTDRITVDITGYETSNRTSITVVDHKGAIVHYIPMDTSLKTVDTKTLGLSAGVYQMILTEGDQYIEQQRVVILK